MTKMKDEEIDQLLSKLSPDEIEMLSSTFSSTKKEKPKKTKAIITYHNTCMFCGYKWSTTSIISFYTTSKPGALIVREFTWCHKCSQRLTELPKETIITRALNMLKANILPKKEAISYGKSGYQEVCFRPADLGDSEEDEVQDEQENNHPTSAPNHNHDKRIR